MFNQYPYLNLNDLNLDYILKAIKEMRYEVTNFVSINAIKYADPIQWDITRQYEKNTIVIDPVTGTAYISVAPVPVGVALTRPEYWTVVFDLQSFVTKANRNLANNYEEQTTTTATMNTTTGNWIIWGDVLYKALVNITAGDAYVVGSNIQRITIEDVIAAILQDIANEVQARQDADTALQGAINNEVQARQDADTALQDAINHEVQARQDADTALQDAINHEVQARQDADGNLSDLTTTNKDSLVDAINEVNSTGGGAIAKIGNLNDLHTSNKANVVSSINEIYDNIDSYIGIDPETYSGNDVQKIQSAYNAAASYINDHPSHNAVILIRRIYDLTDGTVHFNHPFNKAINGHIIFQGINHGGFYSGAVNGFMFDTQITAGTNLWHDFYNLSFFGDPMTLDSRGVFDDNDSSNFAHARVFNMERMSQMRIANCNFTYLGSVYDNRECLAGDVGCYTIISQNNYYERCADVIDLSYSQNAITFENDYIAMGYRFVAASVDLRAMYTLNIINCTVEYLKGFAIQIPNVNSKGLAGLNIKNSYFEGISRSIISIGTAFQTMHIDGCTFQVAGMLTSASEGVAVTLDGECQFSFTNNLIMRSTAASGYGLTASASSAALARKFNCMGLRMQDQQNNTINCINPHIQSCLITDISQLV